MFLFCFCIHTHVCVQVAAANLDPITPSFIQFLLSSSLMYIEYKYTSERYKKKLCREEIETI